jgi:Phosphotransferase enzyme family
MHTLPLKADEISTEWLSGVLGLDVAAFKLEDAHDGTTGRALVSLEYAQENGPGSVFVKLPPADPAQQAFVTSSGMGLREAKFYRQLSTEVPVRVPACYHADWNDTGERYIMLLENLTDSGCTFRNASTRYSLDYVRSVLTEFARLHAHYWQSPRLSAELGWIEPPLQHPIAPVLVSRALENFAGDMPLLFQTIAELYLHHTDAIHRLWQEGAPTLIHGDVHDGNLFWDADRPGFLDWAVMAQGPAMRDVGYFLAGTLPLGDQQLHYREMLEFYQGQLKARDIAVPALGELIEQYSLHAVYVWVGAVVTLAMGEAWQASSYVQRSLERVHNTLEMLDSAAVLRSRL